MRRNAIAAAVAGYVGALAPQPRPEPPPPAQTTATELDLRASIERVRAMIEAQPHSLMERELMRRAYIEAADVGTAIVANGRLIPREEWQVAGVRIIPNAGKQVRVLFRGPTNSEDLIP
jgi:hypothetical protein